MPAFKVTRNLLMMCRMCKNTEATTRGVLKNFFKVHRKTPVPEKETLVEVFSCEFCEISKNTFFHRTPLVSASRNDIFIYKIIQVDQIKIYTSLFS